MYNNEFPLRMTREELERRVARSILNTIKEDGDNVWVQGLANLMEEVGLVDTRPNMICETDNLYESRNYGAEKANSRTTPDRS